MTDTKKRPARNKYDVVVIRQEPIQEGHEFYKASSQSVENAWYDVHIDLVSMTGHCGCKRNDFIPQMQVFDADKQCMHFHCVVIDLVDNHGLSDTRPACIVCHGKDFKLLPAADDNGHPIEGGICIRCFEDVSMEPDYEGLATYQDELETPDYFDMESWCDVCQNDVCICGKGINYD